jgi:serine/threonine-protein kinase
MTDTLARLTAALGQSYRVDRELGAGGMATVYLAHDLKHERDVAIKVLHPDLGAALGADRFLAEIKTTAKLQHPHILPLLDSGAADGLLYYVMPYVKGETLRARLERGPVPIAEAAELLRNVLQALQYAHDAGIVHRDIKPENILLASGTAVVADFGIAKALSTSRTQAGMTMLTQAGTAVGTPAYMAPSRPLVIRTPTSAPICMRGGSSPTKCSPGRTRLRAT